jgi:hypothetical protein
MTEKKRENKLKRNTERKHMLLGRGPSVGKWRQPSFLGRSCYRNEFEHGVYRWIFYNCVGGGPLCGLVIRVPGYRSRGPEFDSRRYQSFWEVVGLERGPLSLVSTTEELLGRESSGSGLESREFGLGDPSRWPRLTLYPQKLAPTSPTKGCRSVGLVRSLT